MQIIGRFRTLCAALPFPLAFRGTLSVTNLTRNSIDWRGAPSISSGKLCFCFSFYTLVIIIIISLPNIIQLGFLSSFITEDIWVPFSKANLKASGLRSSEALTSRTLYPAWRANYEYNTLLMLSFDIYYPDMFIYSKSKY